MKYSYSVKVNGKWYQPNDEVPENEKPAEEMAGSKKETVKK